MKKTSSAVRRQRNFLAVRLRHGILRHGIFALALITIVAQQSFAATKNVFAAGKSSAPNVVLIFADDLGYGDVGCYGATKVKTPNIDRLAAEGRRFTDAHSASAVCTPSRYGLLTGEYPHRKNLWGPCSHTAPLLIDTQKLTLARMFKNKGYATSAFGKWHLGFGAGDIDWNKPLKPGPLELGFDYYFGVPKVNSGFPYVYVENHGIVGWEADDPLVFGKKPFSSTPRFPHAAGSKNPNQFGGAKKAHAMYHDEKIATTLTEKAVGWIDANVASGDGKPFFLYLPTTNIHHPCTPAPRFKGSSQCGLYGDFIHELDWVVGDIMACLNRNKLDDNTIVIFTSDNGGMFNTPGQIAFKQQHKINGPLLGFKFGVWEGGHRVPFIVRWPGKVKPGTVSGQLLSQIDMLATLAAVTGQELSKAERADSLNMLPAFFDEPEKPIREHLILAPNQPSHLSIRKGDWMLIPAQGSGGFRGRKPGSHTFAGQPAVTYVGNKNSDIENGRIKKTAPPGQLYNLSQDPHQTLNLYREHPKVVKELQALLEGYRVKGQPNRRTAKANRGAFKPLGNLRFTFESGKLEGWSIVEGEAGSPVCGRNSLPRHKDRPFNQQGKFHLSTVQTATGFTDKQQVVFQSPAFVIHGSRASFLASGGKAADSLYVGLFDAGSNELLLRAGGDNGPQMKRTTWDVSKLKGKNVYLRVVDQSTGRWGHLTFDDFSVEGALQQSAVKSP